MIRHSSTSIFALAAALASASPVLAERIGTVGAVNPDAVGTPPGGATRTINVGGTVVYRERISTTANGSVQLLFADRTTMNIGPNSQLVIDEFVYDPKTNTGRMAATLTKGVMRFVGGQTSHTGGATIKTPATTLGVRGGVATVSHSGAGTRVVNHFGKISVQTPTGTEILRRPGFQMDIAGGRPPAAPTRVARTEVDTTNRAVTSKGSQTGGRREVPTDQGANRSVGQPKVPSTLASVQPQQPQTMAQVARVTVPPNAMQQDMPLQLVGQIAAAGTQVAANDALTPVTTTTNTSGNIGTGTGSGAGTGTGTGTGSGSGTGTAGAALPTRRFYALSENMQQRVGELIPTGFKPQGNWSESGMLGYGQGGAKANGTPNTVSRVMVAGLVINGQGAGQTSAIYFGNMDIRPESEGVSGGGLTGFSRLDATARTSRLTSSLSLVPGTVTMDANTIPTAAGFDNKDSANGVLQTATSTYTNYPVSAPSVVTNYSFSGGLQQTSTPPTLGSNRPEQTLIGMVAGLWNTHSSTTGQPTSILPETVSGSVTINLTGDSQFGANMKVERYGNRFGPGDDFNGANIAFGYQGAGTRSRSAYVDYDNFGARTARTDGGATLSTISRVSGSTSETAAPTSEDGVFVNSQAVGAASQFPGVTFCQCEYTRWGFWSYTATRSGTNASGQPDSVRDTVHLGTWIAGLPTPASQMPTTGSATYTGHAIGAFKNGSAEYVAAGNFASTVNFGAATATYAISNLDGRNYNGTAILVPVTGQGGGSAVSFDNNNVAGTSASGASIYPHGTFFTGAAGPAGELGGRWNVFGPTTGGAPDYVGSGIFLGKR
ncbi:MAG: FecR domain-containing protein [Proteobacteria bacterium]|nr:FecR domain-containing protein [Pseudomonadota bacterium]